MKISGLDSLQKKLSEVKGKMVDAGRRRHLSFSRNFDTRAYFLEDVQDPLTEKTKEHDIEGLKQEFGSSGIGWKIQNFKDIGSKPFSILSYHNHFFEQIRNSFVIGAYYPALVGACTLGERILNHLILDLRDYFAHTNEYKKVRRKDSFDNWAIPIDTLDSWGVLLPKAVEEFRALKDLRNQSIHFNASTYKTLRKDALAAVLHIREIIDQQFTTFGLRPWLIEGTRGHMFIKKSYEDDPYIKTYFLRQCPFVGPYFSIVFDQNKDARFHDHENYGEEHWTDEEFATLYNDREPEMLAPTASE